MSGLFDKIFKKEHKIEKVDNEKAEIASTCPYCNGELGKHPKRKTTCPFCGKPIYVRTSPSTKEKVLVTEEGAKQIDDEYAKAGYRNSWLNTLGQYGVTAIDFDNMNRSLSERFGYKANDRDTIWQLFNTLIPKTKDLNTLSNIYYSMALFLHYEGKDSFKLQQQSRKMELLKQKNDGIDKVRILAGDDSCDACKDQENKVYSVDEALEKMPIPCKNCSNRLPGEKFSFCRCTYLSELDWKSWHKEVSCD
jgi:hypothetical protein